MLPTRTRPLGGGDLPAGYTRLEYLENVGRLYIMPDAVLGDEIELTFSAEYVNDTNRVVGAEYGTPAVALGIANNGALFIRVRNESQSFVYTPAAGHSKKHVVRIGATEITVNGQVVSAANYQMPEFLPAQFSLFGQIVYKADLSFSRDLFAHPQSRIYSFRNWRGGILRGNYLPALDPAGVPCLFETISRRPFYKVGTGELLYA